MRPRFAAALLCAFASFAQDGARGMALFGLSARPDLRWRLVAEAAQPRAVSPQSQDPRFLRLRAAGLAYAGLPSTSVQAQAVHFGLQERDVRWLLLDPGGKLQAHGAGPWEPGAIEDAIRNVLGELPWDRLDRVLRDRPDHGEARLARLEWALALSFPQEGYRDWQPYRPDSLVVQSMARDALAGLRKVPDWPSQVPLNSPGLGRKLLAILGTDTHLDMARELIAALAAAPANPLLQENLAFLHGRFPADPLDANAEVWEAIEPLPGQPWPPLPLIRAHLDRLLELKRMPEARYKARSWSRPVDRLFLDADAWKLRIRREAWLTVYACVAGTHLEGTQNIIVESLDRIRTHAGPAYLKLTKFYLNRIPFPDDPDFRKKVAEMVARPGLPSPPMPEPLAAWDIRLAERDELPALHSAFSEDPKLVLWLPAERNLTSFPGQAHPIEAWLEKDRIFSPEVLPSRSHLADALAQGRPSRLRMAMEQVEQAPERPGRRRFRIALLEERGLVKPLEHVLAEDLRRAGTYANLENFPIDSNLWWAEAQRAVPELEAGLLRWPMDEERWGALAFWTGFLPNHPGPSALAESQPSWQPRLPFRLALPPSAHARMDEELSRRSAWNQVRAWFEPAWDAIRELKPEDFRRWPWLVTTATTARSCLERAYANLGQDGLRRRLRAGWEDLRLPEAQ